MHTWQFIMFSIHSPATSEGAATYLAVEVIDMCLGFFNSPDYGIRLGAMALLAIPLTECKSVILLLTSIAMLSH